MELYALDKEHPLVRSAADFLFSLQTDEGDFRGIYGNEYSPNYTAGILEVLVHAGYADDVRVDKSFRWLMATRQNDGDGRCHCVRSVGNSIGPCPKGRFQHRPTVQSPSPTWSPGW